jgi:hypothetical protein
VARGIYVKPRVSNILGVVHPGAYEVALAVTEAEGSKLAAHGAAWALKFGLTTQVMTSPTYLTDGSTRRIRHGKSVIILHHASPREMRHASTTPGRAILALQWLGEPASVDEVLDVVRRKLSKSEFAEFLEEASALGGWIAKAARNARAQ